PHHQPLGRQRRHHARRHQLDLAHQGSARRQRELPLVAAQRAVSGDRRPPADARYRGHLLHLAEQARVRRGGLEMTNISRITRVLGIAACVGWLLGAGGCATLPDTQFLSQDYRAQAARFQSAWGPLSAKRSAAIVAELKRTSGDLDILDRQIALEQQIGGALVVGNKVTLLQDGPATYQAMFAAIGRATDHINVESYIFEDGEVGQQFADLLLERQAHGVQVNVIYDSVGAFATGKPFFDRLTQAGVQVLEFNPVNPLAAKKS